MEVQENSRRAFVIGTIFVIVVLVFVVRLFSIQVLDSSYKQTATRNALRKVINYPARGLIYDRNGKLLVYNKAVYDLLVTPREVTAFDTLQLCSMLGVEKDFLVAELSKAKRYSRYKPSIIIKQLSPERYARLLEKLYKYPGFFVQARTLRGYTYPIAAHMLGYVGEVNQKHLEEDSYYKPSDYIGITGLERSYEKELRGVKGASYFLVDVHSRLKGSYNDGQNDTIATLGNNLISTIDADLQAYCEKLMQNKKGAVVAIEPSTGEILAYYSGPSFQPSLLVGQERGKNYGTLSADTLRPLTNRAISAAYSPGSTFKMLNALIALDQGVITDQTAFPCSGSASRPIKCTHYHGSPVKLRAGVKESCNPYFWNAFKASMEYKETTAKSYELWRDYALEFGLGKRLGVEFYGQSAGNIPTVDFYNNIYGEGRWNATTIRSLAIGQGEIILTPLQMANYTAVLANRGYYIEPHLVKELIDQSGQVRKLEFKKHESSINKEHFEPIVDGMFNMVAQTIGRYPIQVKDIEVCGKTGTVQNSSGGSDHSTAIAFAPKDNPKIAIAVFVENGVWGSRYAMPIATLIAEKHIKGEIEEERRRVASETLTNINLLGIHNDDI